MTILPATATGDHVPADRWIEGPAGRIRVSDGGGGDSLPVVLVHGMTGDVAYWAAQLDHLRKSRRAVAFDLRGHGLSDPPADGDHSIDGFAADVAAVVDALDLPAFVLVGHSFGAAVVAAYAGRHPRRVASLVLGDPTEDLSHYPRESLDAFLASLRTNAYEQVVTETFSRALHQATPEVRSLVLARLRAAPREMMVRMYATLLSYDARPDLTRYGGPMLSVTADGNDGEHSLHALVPALRRHAVGGTSHWLMMDRPEEFNRVLDGVLAAEGG